MPSNEIGKTGAGKGLKGKSFGHNPVCDVC